MSDSDFPNDVKILLGALRFADAIEFCKTRSIPYTEIIDQVRDIVDKANKLFDNKNHQKSISLYISTIGVVEPSNVLCRFFSPYLTRYLTQYLVELHKQGYIEKEADTRLLFNLFHHQEERSTLANFVDYLEKTKEEVELMSTQQKSFTSRILKKDSILVRSDINAKKRFISKFKPIAAVETLVDNDMNDYALRISQIFGVSKQIIDLMINTEYPSEKEKKENYIKAANMVNEKVESRDQEGRSLLLEFGPKLLRGDEESASLVEHSALFLWNEKDEHDDVAFLRLFWGSYKHCKNFLEKAIQEKSTPLFVNSYIELLIPNNHFFDDNFKNAKERLNYIDQPVNPDPSKALSAIRDPTIPIDDITPLLFICTELNFEEGVVELLRRKNRFSDILAYYIANRMTKQLVEWVENKDRPEVDSEDWVGVLRYFAADPSTYGEEEDHLRYSKSLDNQFMQLLVSKSQKARHLFSLIKELSKNKNIQFEVIMKDLNNELSSIIKQLDAEEARHAQLFEELQDLNDEIDKLEDQDYEFKPMYCDVCSQKISVPYIGFFCGHNVHLKCCKKGGVHNDDDDDNNNNNNIYDPKEEIVCPICAKKNTELKDLVVPDRMLDLSLDKNTTDLLDTTVKMIEGGYYSQDKY